MPLWFLKTEKQNIREAILKKKCLRIEDLNKIMNLNWAHKMLHTHVHAKQQQQNPKIHTLM